MTSDTVPATQAITKRPKIASRVLKDNPSTYTTYVCAHTNPCTNFRHIILHLQPNYGLDPVYDPDLTQMFNRLEQKIHNSQTLI